MVHFYLIVFQYFAKFFNLLVIEMISTHKGGHQICQFAAIFADSNVFQNYKSAHRQSTSIQ